jgi:hypothetical protein
VEPLVKSMELSQEVCHPPFYLAMAHWQLGAKEEALSWYRKGVQWMEAQKRYEPRLLAIRAETAELLKIEETELLPLPREVP